MFQINRVLFINLTVLNQLELNSIILKKINDDYSSNTCNEDYDAFDQQL